MSASPGTRIVVAGLGGQGVLFTTRLLAETALSLGWQALSSETHGMAQRGGSVAASLAIGSYRCALVLPGEADLLLALDAGEAARNIQFLGPGGHCLVSASEPWAPEVLQAAAEGGVGLHTVDAAGIALRMDAPVLANIALLGGLSSLAFSPVPAQALEQALRRRSPARLLERNLAAFAAGQGAIAHC